MTLLPRESGELISKNAKFLTINLDGVKKLSNEVIKAIISKELDVQNFSQNEHHPKASDPIAIDWIFVVDTLNFCFWTPGDDTKWTVNGQTGYFALCAAINRAVSEGIDITNAEYYSKIELADVEKIFRSDDGVTKVPLIQQRVACLHEVGKKLIEKYGGRFSNCIKSVNGSAKNLLQLITREFPCFRDEATFEGQQVSIYKRAQILVGDIWACFQGTGLGWFADIDEITMFADYRVPQVLVHFGAIIYTKELMDILEKDQLLENGAREEVEIRGASIFAVDLLKDEVLRELKMNHSDVATDKINAILLDHFLWDYRRKFAKELSYIPFHKTLSVYY